MLMDMVLIAGRLVEERSRLGYTRAAFARLLGVTTEGLRLIEAGKTVFRIDVLAHAASAGVDAQYVLTGVRSLNNANVKDEVGYEKQIINGNISGVGYAGSGAQVSIINTTKHITRTKVEAKPGTEHLSDENKRALMDLVNQVVDTEAQLKRDPATHRSVWSSLNKHCGVTSYHMIKLNDFDKARKFLHMWLGRLNSAASAPVKNDDWRKQKIKYIQTNSKEPESQAAMRAYIARKFKATSLTELANDELDQTYKYVAGRRRRVK